FRGPPSGPTPTPTPPGACQMPALDTDFSDLGYFFIDAPNNILVGVTSTGEIVAIAAADIVPDPLVIALGATPISANVALIDFAIVEDLLFDATGEGVRVASGTIFQVNDLIVDEMPLGFDIEGECFSIEPLARTVEESMNKLTTEKVQTRGFDDGTPAILSDFADQVLNSEE
ncbi:hypothetical protein MYX76_18355, partial [Desulfobacterota bacterium AH_259_B03_O07]|nr:hypothetical protein [Desulfobacterota bacterium AH_259_B03_O07]